MGPATTALNAQETTVKEVAQPLPSESGTNLPSLEAPEPSEIAAIVEQLNAPDFESREAASARIREWSGAHGEIVRTPLLQACKKSTSPEVRYRLFSALMDLASGIQPSSKPGFLGIQMMDQQVMIPSDKDGEPNQTTTSIMVMRCVAGTAAQRAGIRTGEHIVSVDDRKVASEGGETASAQFSEYIRSKAASMDVKLEIYSPRTKKVRKVTITLGERPEALEDLRYKKQLAESTVRKWLKEVRCEPINKQWDRASLASTASIQ